MSRRTLIKAAAATGAAGLVPGLQSAVYAQGSDKPEKEEVRIGFIPLTDCASVVMASVLGFDKKYGVKIVATKEASWAGVRDKLVNGELDMAHVLAVKRVFGNTESKARQRERTRAALELVGMGHALLKRPHEISGGMKQRVGIARALAMEPKVLLLDEPFGALDALTRAHLQDELLKIVTRSKSTVVMVTHDVDEAVLLSDRIVMMTNGPAATIGEVLSVELEGPRKRLDLAEDSRYVHYRKQVLDFLYTRHTHVEKQVA